MQLNNETLDGEKRIRVPLFMSDSETIQPPIDRNQQAMLDAIEFERNRQADAAARHAEYVRLGAATMDPTLALRRVEDAQRAARSQFDAMGRDHSALDSEYVAFARELDGRPTPAAPATPTNDAQPEPVRTLETLDAEYLAYVADLEGTKTPAASGGNGPQVKWID